MCVCVSASHSPVIHKQKRGGALYPEYCSSVLARSEWPRRTVSFATAVIKKRREIDVD